MPTSSHSPIHACLRQPTLSDFPGHLAGLLFTSGCNFRCGFCHNAALLANQRSTLTWPELDAVLEEWRANWVDGVVVSGGEPTLQADLFTLVQHLRRFGFAVKLDTNGSRPEVLARLLPHLAYVAMDLKTSLANYETLTGHADPDAIRHSVRLLRDGPTPFEFRTTVIDSVHTDEHLHEIGALISGAPRWILQPFVPRPDLPDPSLRHTRRTAPDRLVRLARELHPFATEVCIRGLANQAYGSTSRETRRSST